jgi:hypothetical protein
MAEDEEKKNSDKILQEQQRLDSERAELIQKATKNAVTFEEKRQQKAALKLLESKNPAYTPSERATLIQKATQNTDTTFEAIRQQKAALKLLGAKTSTSPPKNVANNIPQTEQCSSDFSCGSGYKCVKAPYQGTGACMKAFDQNGAPQYTKDLNSVNPNMKEGCNVGTTCPIGFHCDINLKACVK